MAVQYATITGKFLRPNGVMPLNLKAVFTAVADSGTVKTTDGSVLASRYVQSTDTDGTLEVTLPLLPQADLEPADARWQVVFQILDRAGRPRADERAPKQITFELTGDTTWDALVDVSGVPITASVLTQAIEARDAAVAAKTAAETAATAAQAVGTTNDGIMAAVAADPESDFAAVQSATIARPVGSVVQHRLGADGDEPGAVVVFSPDDGYNQQVADIAVLNALGVPATLNLTGGFIDKAGTNPTWGNDTYITSAQVQAIVNHSVGNEISYHDATDHKNQPDRLTALGAAGYVAYVQGFRTMIKNNFGYDVKTCAWPAGNSTVRVREVLGRCGIEYARGTRGTPGSAANDDPFDTPGVDILTMSLAAIQASIDLAITRRSVVSLLWHGGANAAFRQKLTDVVAYCQSKGVPMKTYYQAMSERTVYRAPSGFAVDAQGNAFARTLRTTYVELGRNDLLGDSVSMAMDLTNNAAYMDGANGQPFDFRGGGLRVTGTRFRTGRRRLYAGTTTAGSPVVSIPTLSTDASIVGATVSGTGVPAGAVVGSYTANTVSLIDSATGLPLNALSGDGTTSVVITLGFALGPVAEFFNRVEFHGGNPRVVGSAASTGYDIYDLLTGLLTTRLTANGLSRSSSGAVTIAAANGNVELQGARQKFLTPAGAPILSVSSTAPSLNSMADGEALFYVDSATQTLKYVTRTAGALTTKTVTMS